MVQCLLINKEPELRCFFQLSDVGQHGGNIANACNFLIAVAQSCEI